MGVNLPVKSPIYKYARLIKNSSDYARRMNRLSNRIFSEVVRPTSESSMRVVNRFAAKPKDLDKSIIDYYPRHEQTFDLMAAVRSYGLYRDEHKDFQEEIERLRALRGKGKQARKEKLSKK